MNKNSPLSGILRMEKDANYCFFMSAFEYFMVILPLEAFVSIILWVVCFRKKLSSCKGKIFCFLYCLIILALFGKFTVLLATKHVNCRSCKCFMPLKNLSFSYCQAIKVYWKIFGKNAWILQDNQIVGGERVLNIRTLIIHKCTETQKFCPLLNYRIIVTGCYFWCICYIEKQKT